MNRKALPAASRKRRRRVTILWTAAVAAVVITLLILEQVAVLYVLATLSVTALLLVVAWADLGMSRQAIADEPPRDDSAAIADGLNAPRSTLGSSSSAARARATKR